MVEIHFNTTQTLTCTDKTINSTSLEPAYKARDQQAYVPDFTCRLPCFTTQLWFLSLQVVGPQGCYLVLRLWSVPTIRCLPTSSPPSWCGSGIWPGCLPGNMWTTLLLETCESSDTFMSLCTNFASYCSCFASLSSFYVSVYFEFSTTNGHSQWIWKAK